MGRFSNAGFVDKFLWIESLTMKSMKIYVPLKFLSIQIKLYIVLWYLEENIMNHTASGS